jgi:integrase
MRGRVFKTTLKSGGISWGFVHDAGRHEDGRRRQALRKGFETKRAADEALREALSQWKQQPAGLSLECSESFKEFMEAWMTVHGAKHWGAMSEETNRRRASYAIREFGEVPLGDLTAGRIQKDLDALLLNGGRKTKEHPQGSPLSRKTIREVTALVSMALDRAVKQRKIARNPVEDVDRVSAAKREVTIIEPEEYEKSLERVRETRYYPLIAFAAASGCRRGEILALKWRDIDLDSGLVTISKSLS